MSGLPAVAVTVPPPVPAAAGEPPSGLLPLPKDAMSDWLVAAMPGVGHGVGRGAATALAAAWAAPRDAPAGVRRAAYVVVQAAAAVATDPDAPAEVRLAAVGEGRKVVEAVARAADRSSERRAGLLARVVRTVGLLAVGALLLHAMETPRSPSTSPPPA